MNDGDRTRIARQTPDSSASARHGASTNARQPGKRRPQHRSRQHTGQRRAQQRPPRHEVDDERNHQIELFLDRQRPGDPEPVRTEVSAHRHPDVLGQGGIRPPRQRPRQQPGARRKRRRDDRGGAQRQRQHQEIERENPAGAAKIEHAEIVAGAAMVDQDPGDQEPRQHEEEIDAAPRQIHRAHDAEVARRVRRQLAVDVVPDQHEQDSDAAHAVQLRHPR